MTTEGVYIDDIRCFAPQLIHESDDYPFEVFSRIDELETNHFWYRGRRKSILALLSRYQSHDKYGRCLEIGGGTGANAEFLREQLGLKILVSEISIEAIKNARKKYPGNEYIQMDARDIPFDKSFDMIGMFDVIEHIEEDYLVMAQVNKALCSKGLLAMSVPQYQWLWSSHDELSGHKRRYTRKSLHALVSNGGFEVISMTSFLFTAFPLMLLARRSRGAKPLAKESQFSDVSGMELPRTLNKILYLFTWADSLLIRSGIRLPFGGSLLVLCRKVI
jgi:2-polyprenyl-3-methyl-5-hydroxy-6-metoxy-1,4-benzoquinol methylase